MGLKAHTAGSGEWADRTWPHFAPGGLWRRVDALDPAVALAAFVALAFALRLLTAFFFAGMVGSEGAEYATIARNIMSGRGYSGLVTEGPELIFPPLFPALIAAFSFLTNDFEWAGRLVSMIFGALLVVPTYLIARRIFGRRTALFAGALVAVHPFLIRYSIAIFTETMFLTLILTAIYMSMRSASSPTLRNVGLAGAFYGLAYLVRQEAFAYLLLGIGFMVLAIALRRPSSLRRPRTVSRLALLPLIFCVLAGPYVGWLGGQTGQFRIEAKSPLNLATERRVQSGMSIDEAAFGIDADLTPRGVWIQPNLASIESYPLSRREVFGIMAKAAEAVAKNTVAMVIAYFALGGPLLFGLAVLGLFSTPWGPRQTLDNAHLMAVLGLVVFGTFFIYYSNERFYLPFIPVLGIWASAGVLQLVGWAEETAEMWGASRFRQIAGATSALLAAALLLLPSLASSYARLTADRAERGFKYAMVDLASRRNEPLRVADSDSQLAYHANGKLIWLPFTDESTALRYLARKGTTHVVVRQSQLSFRPYLARWFENGVPGAHEAADVVSATGERLKIFGFDRPGEQPGSIKE
jgi:4-amino-4-deoxy-L-arabinose transferase-like glycosyltransferase